MCGSSLGNKFFRVEKSRDRHDHCEFFFSFTFGDHVFVVFASTSILGTTTREVQVKKKKAERER